MQELSAIAVTSCRPTTDERCPVVPEDATGLRFRGVGRGAFAKQAKVLAMGCFLARLLLVDRLTRHTRQR